MIWLGRGKIILGILVVMALSVRPETLRVG